jgi:2-iminobutanoate/2-iminopropanoate deaminase
MGFEIIKVEGMAGSKLLSAATKAGGFVFLSGQGSVGPDGKIVPDTFEGEFHRTFDNCKKVLAAAGLDLSHVVRVNSYVRDEQDLALYNKLYGAYFPSNPPARTTIIKCLGAIKYEVDMIAYAG